MIKKCILWSAPLLLAISFFISWPITYAAESALTSNNSIAIEAASVAGEPCWTAYSMAIGGFNQPYDLFYIETDKATTSATLGLSLTNTYELSHVYRYLILKISSFGKTNYGKWVKLNPEDNGTPSETYLNLHNGHVSLPIADIPAIKLQPTAVHFTASILKNRRKTIHRSFSLR